MLVTRVSPLMSNDSRAESTATVSIRHCLTHPLLFLRAAIPVELARYL